MNDLNEFRSIADDMMSDVRMTDEIKKKVMLRCRERRKPPIGYLARAACLALVLGLAVMFSVSPPKRVETGPENSLLMATDMARPMEGGRVLDSFEEARKDFKGTMLVPSYIPEGFALTGIEAQGLPGEAPGISMEYSNGDRSFRIIEEYGRARDDHEGYDTVDINGNMGYLRRYSLDTAYGDDIYTELIWFSDGTRYAVLGFIIEEDAAKTARSMK